MTELSLNVTFLFITINYSTSWNPTSWNPTCSDRVPERISDNSSASISTGTWMGRRTWRTYIIEPIVFGYTIPHGDNHPPQHSYNTKIDLTAATVIHL